MPLRTANLPASRHAQKVRAGLKVSLGAPKPPHLATCYFSSNKLVPVEFSVSTFQEFKKQKILVERVHLFILINYIHYINMHVPGTSLGSGNIVRATTHTKN